MSSVRAAVALVLLAGCTLTHPLGEYSAGLDEPSDGGDAPLDGSADSPSTADAGDGCVGNPTIIAPTPGATLGASFQLKIAAPSCLTKLTLYVEDTPVQKDLGSDQQVQVAISVGAHRLSVNGWTGNSAQTHKSASVPVTRAT